MSITEAKCDIHKLFWGDKKHKVTHECWIHSIEESIKYDERSLHRNKVILSKLKCKLPLKDCFSPEIE